MDYIGISSIKEAYAQSLLEDKMNDRAFKIYEKGIKEPIFNSYIVHAESEPSLSEMNSKMTDIATDIMGLNKEFAHAAAAYSSLVSNVIDRLAAVNSALSKEESRINDLNNICSSSDFESIKTIPINELSGLFYYDNDVLMGYTDERNIVDLEIVSVKGNGYNGNAHVYNKTEEVFQSEIKNTGHYPHIVDGDIISKFEYSRLTSTDNVPPQASSFVNLDKEEARCTVTLSSKNNFNSLKINTGESVVLEDVRYSTDEGKTFYSCLPRAIKINSKEEKYSNENYIYGSGIISFPYCNTVQVTLRSSGTTDDVIAYEAIQGDGETTPAILPNVKRHVISIYDITAYSGTFKNGFVKTGELVSVPCDSIGIFALEYIPEHFSNDKNYVEYVLTVNGIDYDVIPINSHKNEIKAIKCVDYSVDNSYVKHIAESIKSASLKIKINTMQNGETPYVSNLKICYGKMVG